jgi:uncharacterized protein DUF3309
MPSPHETHAAPHRAGGKGYNSPCADRQMVRALKAGNAAFGRAGADAARKLHRFHPMNLILLVLLLVLIVGALPAWPYSNGWGYAPSGTLGTVLLILLVLALLGRV